MKSINSRLDFNCDTLHKTRHYKNCNLEKGWYHTGKLLFFFSKKNISLPSVLLSITLTSKKKYKKLYIIYSNLTGRQVSLCEQIFHHPSSFTCRTSFIGLSSKLRYHWYPVLRSFLYQQHSCYIITVKAFQLRASLFCNVSSFDYK